MSNLFKYKMKIDADLATEERDESHSFSNVSYLAFILVCTIIITVFSAMVTVLNYCFPNALNGTYLKLFF